MPCVQQLHLLLQSWVQVSEPAFAGALAVEVMAATLQHPLCAAAPAAADDPLAADSDALPLGPAPHMIRGRLGGGVQQARDMCWKLVSCSACTLVMRVPSF